CLSDWSSDVCSSDLKYYFKDFGNHPLIEFMTQDQALSILKTGVNIFLTGEPGSGKTHTVNRYVEYLRSCGIEPAITASTGIAARSEERRVGKEWYAG